MKYFRIFSTLALLPCLALGDTPPPLDLSGPTPYLEEMASLPLQAGVCDIVGIGHVINVSSQGVSVVVDTYWTGNPGSNTLSITIHENIPPATNAPIVFFATKYLSFLALEPAMCRYSYIFDMDYHRNRHSPEGLYLFDDESSWFPVTTNNAELVKFSSNLVYAAQVAINTNMFYEIIRDGVSMHSTSSRIHQDSIYAFWNIESFMPTNRLMEIWADSSLTNSTIRAIIRNRIHDYSGEWPQ